ncbi:unnamed protein product [Protopolystoma xenopodis]|uniref:Uncharacterized protein n=1 Tax=Protopolystoma xenopodis TaxID=117903 RepID=A0A3S5CRG5_9PLAT|nr:unnamed protein product [Protopolystoma xenopodis]
MWIAENPSGVWVNQQADLPFYWSGSVWPPVTEFLLAFDTQFTGSNPGESKAAVYPKEEEDTCGLYGKMTSKRLGVGCIRCLDIYFEKDSESGFNSRHVGWTLNGLVSSPHAADSRIFILPLSPHTTHERISRHQTGSCGAEGRRQVHSSGTNRARCGRQNLMTADAECGEHSAHLESVDATTSRRGGRFQRRLGGQMEMSL